MSVQTLLAVPSILDIPRLCGCTWDEPDWDHAPHARRWKLREPDPGCPFHYLIAVMAGRSVIG
jgi:hypothetical protein